MTTINRPFKIKFISIREIRMGSPYNGCDIKFIGQTNIKLGEAAWWQDKFAWSDDNKYLVLVQWNMDNNDPGFHLTIFNTLTGQSQTSERIIGMVNNLSVTDNRVLYNKFLYIGKSEDGKLLDNTDNKYEFQDF
jgi:hypothetical protein